MSSLETLGHVFCEIDTSTEISHAILSELMENMEEDDRSQYIILGVLQQLENIKKHLNALDETMKGGAAA